MMIAALRRTATASWARLKFFCSSSGGGGVPAKNKVVVIGIIPKRYVVGGGLVFLSGFGAGLYLDTEIENVDGNVEYAERGTNQMAEETADYAKKRSEVSLEVSNNPA